MTECSWVMWRQHRKVGRCRARAAVPREFGCAGRRGSTPRRGAGLSGLVAAAKEKVRLPHDQVTLRGGPGRGKVGPDYETDVATGWSAASSGQGRAGGARPVSRAQQVGGQAERVAELPDGGHHVRAYVAPAGPGRRRRPARSRSRSWRTCRPSAVACTVEVGDRLTQVVRDRGSGRLPVAVRAEQQGGGAPRPALVGAPGRLTRIRLHVSSSRCPRANRHGWRVAGRGRPAGRLQQRGRRSVRGTAPAVRVERDRGLQRKASSGVRSAMGCPAARRPPPARPAPRSAGRRAGAGQHQRAERRPGRAVSSAVRRRSSRCPASSGGVERRPSWTRPRSRRPWTPAQRPARGHRQRGLPVGQHVQPVGERVLHPGVEPAGHGLVPVAEA